MEIVKWRFAIYFAVTAFIWSETTAFKAKRIRKEFKRVRKEMRTLKKDISLTRDDIRELFDTTNRLNISAVQACGRCTYRYETISASVTKHVGMQNMVTTDSINVLPEYQSLVRAFAKEKTINRDLKDQFRSMENIISAGERLANERDTELRNQLQFMKNIISSNKQLADERGRELESRMQSVEDMISTSKKAAVEKDQEVQDQLRSLRGSIDNTISDIYRDLHDNMTAFMTMVSNRIDEHLRKAEATSVNPDISTVPITNTNCSTVPVSGVYTIFLEATLFPTTVYCDQDTDGGGWIVVMRQQDGSVNFFRPWLDYKHGFGSPDGEFWAGNELLHRLTKERPMQLRIDLEDFDGNTAYALYNEFQVGAEEDKYRLHVFGYSGTAGDSLIDIDDEDNNHDGMQFTTFDFDNDNYYYNCAERWQGGWWYNSCFAAKLNSPYSPDKERTDPEGILWYSWKGYLESLKRVELKIRSPKI